MMPKNFLELVPNCFPVSIEDVHRAMTCVAVMVHTQCQNTSVVAVSWRRCQPFLVLSLS